MCASSMIVDYYYEKWSLVPVPPTLPTLFLDMPVISPEEVTGFRKLLERARDYDKKTNQEKCETSDKVKKLKQLAKELGIDLSFIEEPT